MWVTQMVFVYLRINKNGESQKIKVMKTKNNNNTFSIDEIHFGPHFNEGLKLRFPHMSVEEVKSQMNFFKRGSISSPFNQVRNKIANYAHQVVFYNQRHNMMFAECTQ